MYIFDKLIATFTFCVWMYYVKGMGSLTGVFRLNTQRFRYVTLQIGHQMCTLPTKWSPML